jgi:hypothetical protein
VTEAETSRRRLAGETEAGAGGKAGAIEDRAGGEAKDQERLLTGEHVEGRGRESQSVEFKVLLSLLSISSCFKMRFKAGV